MADFCGRCRDDEGWDDPGEFIRHNDFEGIAEGDDLIVGLCEGCGVHWFDDKGYPQCKGRSESWYKNPDQSFLSCEYCKLSVVEGGRISYGPVGDKQ